MAHEPELLAATYLVGGLDPAACSDYERHLLACDDCWLEVSLAREGRAVAEGAREVAPSHLRERIRSTLAQSNAPADLQQCSPTLPTQRAREHRSVIRMLAVAAAIALVVAYPLAHTRTQRQPAVIAAALAAYHLDRLPGRDMVHEPMPDLSSVGLAAVGAGTGSLADMSVSAFAYRSGSGSHVVVYIGEAAFPLARGAVPMGPAGGPWEAHLGSAMVICARQGHSMLIVGSDEALVRKVGAALKVV